MFKKKYVVIISGSITTVMILVVLFVSGAFNFALSRDVFQPVTELPVDTTTPENTTTPIVTTTAPPIETTPFITTEIPQETTDVTVTTTEAITYPYIPPYDETVIDNEWALFLVNADNPLPNNYVPQLAKVVGSFQMDKRAAKYAIAMLLDAANDGVELTVISAYRSYEKQQDNFNDYMLYLEERGYSKEEAYKVTLSQIALPGTSEHNAGLALDIVSPGYYTIYGELSDEFEETEQFRWLYENSWKYGFILRYPKDKQNITNIIYEPWHYRFVGRYHAHRIYESGLTLEEYIETIINEEPQTGE